MVSDLAIEIAYEEIQQRELLREFCRLKKCFKAINPYKRIPLCKLELNSITRKQRKNEN